MFMKRFIALILTAVTLLSFAGCGKVNTPAVLPAHTVLQQSASADGADAITGAYILATDTAINIVADKLGSGDKIQYISFDFGTSFALKQTQRDVLVKAFDVYGIPVDTNGESGHSELAERNRGFVLQYIVGNQYNKKEFDHTITVEVLHGNKGYAYYFDFNIFSGEYVLVNYEEAYEKMR